MINNTIKRIVFTVFAVLIATPILFTTFKRNAIWKGEMQLWADVAGKGVKKARVYNILGNAYNSDVQYDMAIENYNKAIALDPNHDKAYYNRGLAYKNKGQYDRAIEDWGAASNLNPNDIDTYYNRGLAYKETGQYDKAIEDFKKACNLGDNDGCTQVRDILWKK